MTYGEPALTDRLRLVQETEIKSYGVVLMHPGVNLTTQPDTWPRDLASIVIRIRDLLSRAALKQGEASAIYIYDNDDSGGIPIFLGAGQVVPGQKKETADITWYEEIEIQDLRALHHDHRFEDVVLAANKEWTVIVTSLPETFQPDVLFVILGGCIIIVASILLSFWVWSNTRRIARYNRERAEAEQEKAALILDNAKQAALAERNLNDFIAYVYFYQFRCCGG